MKRIVHRLGVVTTAAALALLAVPAHAAGTVQVQFVKPETFVDVRDARLRSEDNLKALQRLIEEVGGAYIADGQTLKIEVLDVDLAGEVRVGTRLNDVRVLRGRADWPRMALRYTLEAPGAAPRSGQANIADMAYLQRITPTAGSTEAMVYERRMLDDWFKAEFKR